MPRKRFSLVKRTSFLLFVLFLAIFPGCLPKVKEQLCTSPLVGSHNMRIWVLMHAWDEPQLLRKAMASVVQQKTKDSDNGRIHVELVVFVDRCGAQADAKTRFSCKISSSCTLLDRADVHKCPSLGSAAAKVALLSHLKSRIKPNEYFTFLDGDDTYASVDSLLNIYRSTLLPKRPYFAWGAHSGKFAEQCRDISDIERTENLEGRLDVRQLSWSFCHPRFFRGDLLEHIAETDFKRDDGEWLQKATDRPLIYMAMELGGLSNSVYIERDAPHVKYSFTSRNGLKRFSNEEAKQDKLLLINRRPHHQQSNTKIHVFCAVHERKNTETFLDSFLSSRLPDYTELHVHIANNAPFRQFELEAMSLAKSVPSITFDVTDMGGNHGGMARFILVARLMKKVLLDFAIFIDDDQYVNDNTIAELWSQRRTMAMVSWYGKCWSSAQQNYWKETFGMRHARLALDFPDHWHYAGTGMSIVDTLIFSDSRVFEVPKRYYFVEDLWLSYVLRASGWYLKRAFVNFTWDENLNLSGQYNVLMDLKEQMFEDLQRCNVPLITSDEYKSMQKLQQLSPSSP